MTHALGRRAGTWAAFEVDLTVGRQNGKGAVLEARELSGIEIFGNRLIIHTAHQLKTSEEARMRMEQICEESPDLDRRVKRVVRTNGKEAIEFWNTLRTGVGARILYNSRSKGSGRGFAGADLVVMDEKMFLEADPMAALLPTLATSPDPQVWYTGSAHFDTSEQQIQLRDRMLSGGDPELCAMEWSVEEGTELDDHEGWAQANPALGYRITPKYLQRELLALGAEEFGREHLGIGGAHATKPTIDPDTWTTLADRTSQIDTELVFGVDVNPERTQASIVAAGLRRDGRVHVELLPRKPGVSWVVKRLAELDVAWAPRSAPLLDPGGPAGSLIPALTEAGLEPVLISGRELAQACGAFYDDVMGLAPRVRHLGQPVLNAAVDAGRKRPLGDAWAWHRRDTSADISPLVAATLAHHGVERPTKRRKRSGKAVFT